MSWLQYLVCANERSSYCGSPHSAIAVLAEVQSPSVCLMASHLTVEEAYLDMPCLQTGQLFNQTLLTTTFQWGQVTLLKVHVNIYDCVLYMCIILQFRFNAHTICVRSQSVASISTIN